MLQYNLKGLRKAEVAFEKPGFEINSAKGNFKLDTKNLAELIDIQNIESGINAIPRIQPNRPLQPTKKLADLEHAVMVDALTAYAKVGAQPLNG